MKMTRFRIQNYKKIHDTGWVSTGALAVLVGKNESGKSSVFRALSRINPSDGAPYDGLKEFPRRRYASEFRQQDWPVASAEFVLTEGEAKELGNQCGLLKGTTHVTCTRHYSGHLDFEFAPELKIPDVSNGKLLQDFADWTVLASSAITDGQNADQLGELKTKVGKVLSERLTLLKAQPGERSADEPSVLEPLAMIQNLLSQQWQKDAFKSLADEMIAFRLAVRGAAQIQGAEKWLEDQLPRFVYFDRYDVIDSAIHVPTFIQQLKNTPDAPRVRATKALFTHVGLIPEDLVRLDPTQPSKAVQDLQKMADERQILVSSASAEMTRLFSDWWEQRRHKFRYGLDGPFFRVWVSDDLDPSEIELDQRSAGMQYFFSFYLVFLVERRGSLSNSILLLDEAGLQLHGTAQGKIVLFLEKLSESNQVLYTTHSPFMIDGDHLDRVRIVYEDPADGTTRVSEDAWPNDPDALFPLQAGLGYAIAQTLFQGKRQLVVEGITDYQIVKALAAPLESRSLKGLRSDVVVVPCGGVSHLMPLASLLVSQSLETVVMLDGDVPGRSKGREVKEKLLLSTFFVGDYTPTKGPEIEDMFSQSEYLNAVKEAYPELTEEFQLPPRTDGGIVDRVIAAFKALGREDFEKWKVAAVLVRWIGETPEKLSRETLEAFSALFSRLNNAWSTVA